MKKTKIKTSLLYVFLFAIVFYIIKCAPLLSDDYVFLTCNAGTIKEAMYESLHYGNGRAIGNFLTIFLVQHQTLMDIERSIIITLLIILLPKTIKNSNSQNVFLHTVISAILVLGMCPPIFSGVFSWASGCHNYVPPVLLSVICFLLVKSEEKSAFRKAFSYIFIFFLGAASQLFLELNTAVNICFAAFLIIYYFITSKKKLPKACVWFVATIVGGAVMFVIPKIFSPSNLDDVSSYRNIHMSSFYDFISSVSTSMFNAMYTLHKNEILYVIIAVLTIVMLKKQKDRWKNRIIYGVCSFVTVAVPALLIINCVIGKYSVYTKIAIWNDMFLTAASFAFAVVFILTILHMTKGIEKTIAIICVAFAVISVGPMMVISPFTSRCLFMFYIFITIAVLVLLDYLTKEISAEKIKTITKAGILVLGALACCLAIEFTDIYWLDTQQVNYIETRLKEKPSEIEIVNFDSEYIHSGKIWQFALYYYNEMPYDITFKETPFDVWYANRQAEGWF